MDCQEVMATVYFTHCGHMKGSSAPYTTEVHRLGNAAESSYDPDEPHDCPSSLDETVAMGDWDGFRRSFLSFPSGKSMGIEHGLLARLRSVRVHLRSLR